MSLRPCYFVVSRVNGGAEVPAIWWDELPREPIRNLVYVVRLDELPNAETLCAASLRDLFAVFLMLRKRGKLPPRWQPPPRANAEKPTARAGYREEMPGVRIERHAQTIEGPIFIP